MKKIFVALVVLAASFQAKAQETIYPAPAQKGTFALVHGTIHVGNGEIIEDGMIVITDGKIVSVGAYAANAGIKFIDCSGDQIYPGLISPVTNLGLDEIEAVRSTQDDRELGDFNPNIHSFIAYNTDSKIINTVRTNGILLANVIPEGGTISGASSVMQLDAWNWEDALYKKDGSYWFVPDNDSQSPLFLRSDIKLHQDNDCVVADFCLNESESAFFVFGEINSEHNKDISAKDIYNNTYHATIEYWQNWISKCIYTGYWEEVIRRSALTLKLLFSHKYGSIVAAPSFSFPEAIGEGRNWDYRYTWIRDAAFSMYAFLELGFIEEASRFLEWVKKRSSENQLQLMFAIDGATDLDEKCLDYLEGYKCSKPVRIGNDAHKQTQMDIYGELLETIYVFAKHGGDITYDYWKIIEGYVELVIKDWQKPDRSIWEVRGPKREFLFSKIMCWVAIDRAIKIANMFSFPFDIMRWHEMRDKIYKYVYENYWNDEKKAFVQFKGSNNLDASTLLMPILKMISPQSDRWKKTMEGIEKELKSDVLIYRYREQDTEIDGLKGKEGTFCMCSFWYIQCLALAGDMEKAREHFEKMLGYSNHLGLYAEELSMKGEHLGNFPQAFTHLALINAAIELNKKDNSISNMRNFAKSAD